MKLSVLLGPLAGDSRGDGTVVAGVIAGAVALLTGYLGLSYTHRGETIALKSEAGYLCNAMAWQAVYAGSDRSPENWKDYRTAPVELKSAALDNKPLFAFRTPAFSKLQDKIGDTNTDAGPLTDFYNRVQFLNLLNKARSCFSDGNAPDFQNMYLCTIAHNLNACADQKYGRQKCYWTPVFSERLFCQVDYDDTYKRIADDLIKKEGGPQVCDKWVQLGDFDLKKFPKCDHIEDDGGAKDDDGGKGGEKPGG